MTGTLQVSISEIDNAAPYLLNTKWSANSARPTNQDVTVTLTFSKKITRVQSDITPDTVKVLLSGNTATIRYSGNTPAMNLYFQSVNGMMTEVVELPEISNIDRTAPVIEVSAPVVSKDGKQAEVSFTANERVSFREGSRVGESFNRTVKENGTYTFNFADMVGNTVAVSVQVEGIVTEALTMRFSLNADGSGVTESPEALGKLSLGGSFYVNLNRAATIDFDLAKHEYTSGWMELTLGDKSGGAIGATDIYGNTVSAVFPDIIYPDVTAPTMELSQYTIHVSDSITAVELEQMLLDNLQTVDDRGGAVNKTVTMPGTIAEGDYTVIYTARDEAGNEATISGRVTIYAGAVPSVWLDGEFVERERIYLADGNDPLQFKVDMQGQPYSVVYKKNIKTVAQMKTGATELELKNDTVQLPFHGNPGYYTVCVTMQDRDQYRIVIFIQ